MFLNGRYYSSIHTCSDLMLSFLDLDPDMKNLTLMLRWVMNLLGLSEK